MYLNDLRSIALLSLNNLLDFFDNVYCAANLRCYIKNISILKEENHWLDIFNMQNIFIANTVRKHLEGMIDINFIKRSNNDIRIFLPKYIMKGFVLLENWYDCLYVLRKENTLIVLSNSRLAISQDFSFSGLYFVKNLYIENIDLHARGRLDSFFSGCVALEKLCLKNFNTRHIVSMVNMFGRCTSLVSLDIKLDTRNCENMQNMFSDCSSLIELDLSYFDTKNLKCTDYMFIRCTSLKCLNLSKWDYKNIQSLEGMFAFCNNFTELLDNGLKEYISDFR